MSFDDIPEDDYEVHECKECGGNIRRIDIGRWICDKCDKEFAE